MATESRSPSPITTWAWKSTSGKSWCIACTAAASASTSSPCPIHRAEARAAASVTRTTSRARLRSIVAPFLGLWDQGLSADKPLHDRPGLRHHHAGSPGTRLVVTHRLLYSLPDILRRKDGKRHWIRRVGFNHHGCRMVRHQQHPPSRESAQSVENRADHFRVEIFQGLDFLVGCPHVPGFVGGFDMEEEKVLVAQRRQPIFGFAQIIGIEKAGGARHVDDL